MNVKVELKNNLFIPKYVPFLDDYSHRWEVWYGGAASGKSYTVAQKILIRCLNQKIRVLVCRKYGTTIRNTVFKQFKDLISLWHLDKYARARESDFNISFANGSEIIFLGLDEETKLLSISNITVI